MTIKDKLRALGRQRSLRYALSLPERTLRSAAALTAGVVHEVAAVAVPIGVRRGRLYRNLVDVTLRFLIESVGQVEGAPGEEPARANFLLRKAAGNSIEIMGIVAFRASPVWVLAALSDVCGFGRQLIPEIATALKEQGLLEQSRRFATMEQLLEGLERSTAQLADTVNTPPLDVASLRQEWQKLATEVKRLPAPKLPSRRAVTGLWSELRAAADKQGRSIFAVSSVLALAAVGELPERARVLSKSAAVAFGRSGTVLAGTLLGHYRDSLRTIRQVGFLDYAARQLKPYARAARKAFSPQQATLTGRMLDRI